MKDVRDLVERDGGSDEEIGWKYTGRDDGRCSVLIGEIRRGHSRVSLRETLL